MNVTIFSCELDEGAVFSEQAGDFGITPHMTHDPVSDDSIHLARGSRCISIGHKSAVTHAHLLALREAGVEYISTRSIGYNHIDVDYAASLGITVENVAYSPDSVADHTLMLILMALRNAKSTVLDVQVHDYRLSQVRGRELRDLTVGVIGTGRIGAAVVTRLHGFGCEILANDTFQSTSAEYLPIPELLQRSDIVTLHVPLDESTHHLLDASAFEQLKPGALVVNTGRGGLIDTDALLASLESGRLGGAALDVVEGEEEFFYADRSNHEIEESRFTRLHRMPNVTITPHSAFYTERALRDTVINSLINCQRYDQGVQHD
jgi:D-specific alpha-keto acid dehydrogenase